MTKEICTKSNQKGPVFILPELPYAKNALGNYYSEKLINLHHGKHHNAYVTNLNAKIANTEFENLTLEEIILKSSSVSDSLMLAIFNNSAQIWNHSFFWHCMTPNFKALDSTDLLAAINRDFGSFDKFRETFINTAVQHFASGWCWLVLDSGNLKIVTTKNAETVFTSGMKPLLTVDVWEHAYYPDYENRRIDFVTTFFDHLINWEFVIENYMKHVS